MNFGLCQAWHFRTESVMARGIYSFLWQAIPVFDSAREKGIESVVIFAVAAVKLFGVGGGTASWPDDGWF